MRVYFTTAIFTVGKLANRKYRFYRFSWPGQPLFPPIAYKVHRQNVLYSRFNWPAASAFDVSCGVKLLVLCMVATKNVGSNNYSIVAAGWSGDAEWERNLTFALSQRDHSCKCAVLAVLTLCCGRKFTHICIRLLCFLALMPHFAHIDSICHSA